MQEVNEDFATEKRKKKRTLIDTQSNNNYKNLKITIKFKTTKKYTIIFVILQQVVRMNLYANLLTELLHMGKKQREIQKQRIFAKLGQFDPLMGEVGWAEYF